MEMIQILLSKKYGSEAFKKLLGSAKEYFDAKLDKELKAIDLSSAAEKTKLLQELA
jgi:hypothetical protein